MKIVPFFIPLLAGVAVRVIDHYWEDDDKDLFVYLAVISNIGTILLIWPHHSILSIVLAFSALFILTAHDYYQSRGVKVSGFVADFLFITFGLAAALATENLLLVFSGLFIVSVAATYLVRSYGGAEVAKKFWFAAFFSDMVFIFGAVSYFGAVGTFNIMAQPELSHTINEVAVSGKFFIIGISFMLTAFLMKLAVFPLHWWTLDISKLSSTPLSSIIIVFVRGAVAFIMMCVLSPLAPMWGGYFTEALMVISVATMTWANISALKSGDTSTLITYSSMASIGYILMLFVSLSTSPAEAGLSITLLTIVFMLSHLGAFSATQMFGARSNLDGLGARRPWIAFVFSLFMAALAGFPPFLGFIAKYAAITTLAATGHYALLSIFAANIALGVYCYMRPLTSVYFFRPVEGADREVEVEYPLIVAVVVAVVTLIYLGLMPSSLITWLKASL